MKKSKKSLFRGFVVAGVFAVSLLNLSVNFQNDAEGNIDLGTLNISSQSAKATGVIDTIIGFLSCPGVGHACSMPYEGNVQSDVRY